MAEHVCKCAWARTPHATWGDCVRSKGLQVGDLKGRGRNRAFDKSLDDYESARRQGIQPDTTFARDVRRAVRQSDETGVAYRAPTL
jgi:hypothetical protein